MAADKTTPGTVGLIGTGLLGSAIADRLMKADFEVWGHDASSAAMSRFAESGGRSVLGISDVGKAARHIILCLPDSAVVQDVLVKIVPRLRPGTIIIDTTTGDPETTRKASERLAKADIGLIDAAVLGSSEIMRNGEAMLLIGAEPSKLADCQRIIDALAQNFVHVGPVGSGQKMKLVANLVLGLNRAVLAEGLHFGRIMNLNDDDVLNVLRSGVTYSKVMDSKGPKMIAEDFEPQAKLSQHFKDVRLILDYAGAADSNLPLSKLHSELLTQVENEGHGDLDNSAIIKAWTIQDAGKSDI